MRFTDTHCHLDFYDFDPDRRVVLAHAREAGLSRLLVPAIDLVSSRSAIQLAESHADVYAAVGVHPNSSSEWQRGTLGTLRELASHPKVVAIGEIGLDYYRDRAPRDHQREVFRVQLALARELALPVIIHVRNSRPSDRACIDDVISILSAWEPGVEWQGVVHSYSGDETEAKALMALGFYIGITGPITYKSAAALKDLVATLPLERLLIETDSPFLPPHPYRGQRNEPAYVVKVAEKIAELRQAPLESIASQTTANAARLFGWGVES
jgi:TatD DNase family protein